MNRIENTYKRAPLKRHLYAWPFRSSFNEGGEKQSGRESWSSIKIQLIYDWTFLIVSRVPMNIFQLFLAQIKDKILDSMSYNFQILGKFSLGHAKSWRWGREFEEILNFFFNSSRAVLFSEGQKNICWASLGVKFHKLSNCIFKNALSLFFTEISWFKVSSDF